MLSYLSRPRCNNSIFLTWVPTIDWSLPTLPDSVFLTYRFQTYRLSSINYWLISSLGNETHMSISRAIQSASKISNLSVWKRSIFMTSSRNFNVFFRSLLVMVDQMLWNYSSDTVGKLKTISCTIFSFVFSPVSVFDNPEATLKTEMFSLMVFMRGFWSQD